jgi:hypothetical protein
VARNHRAGGLRVAPPRIRISHVTPLCLCLLSPTRCLSTPSFHLFFHPRFTYHAPLDQADGFSFLLHRSPLQLCAGCPAFRPLALPKMGLGERVGRIPRSLDRQQPQSSRRSVRCVLCHSSGGQCRWFRWYRQGQKTTPRLSNAP